MRIVEKAQLMSAPEIDRTLQRLAHEIVEKSGGTKHLALIGIRRARRPVGAANCFGNAGVSTAWKVPVGTLGHHAVPGRFIQGCVARGVAIFGYTVRRR